MTAFICNLCGADGELPETPPGREIPSCASCKSTVRLRAMAALLAKELVGIPLALPDFPILKGIRGVGLSDPPELAARLEGKLDYTNTFYHQPPSLDVTQPDPADFGRYDFIISSEVMEHVPVPVEAAFANLCRLLKPHGFLLLTVPYRIEGKTQEHFPELHEYTLASPGGRTVLVNRRRDGAVEVFENLCFHGGHGSTLEMRVFTEDSLKQTLLDAGFRDVHIASEDVLEFGVRHAETWSLPVLARKERFPRPSAELATAYRDATYRTRRLERDLAALKGDYEHYIEFHKKSHADVEAQLAERAEWVRKVEADFAERTTWALQLEKDREAAMAELVRVQSSEAEAWKKAAALERELGDARAAQAALEAQLWTRAGRKLRLTRR